MRCLVFALLFGALAPAPLAAAPRDGAPPLVARNGALPVVARDGALPVVARNGTLPVVARDGALPLFARDGARPVVAPAMPAGYATIFMGPPRGNFPSPPARPPAPAAAPPPAPQRQPADPAAICRAAIATAEREHMLPPQLLAAIARVESGRRDPATGTVGPWPWTINAEGRGNFFPDKAAALAGVRQMQAQGMRSIDIGCMQVNLRHHPNAFPSLEDGFDPLTNARYAARFLRELSDELGDWNRAAAAYHSRTPEFAVPYLAKVMAAWAVEKRQPAPVALAAAAPERPALPLGGGGAFLSNQPDRAQLVAGAGGGGRGLDAYRQAPIAAIGRMPVVYNGPDRRL